MRAWHQLFPSSIISFLLSEKEVLQPVIVHCHILFFTSKTLMPFLEHPLYLPVSLGLSDLTMKSSKSMDMFSLFWIDVTCRFEIDISNYSMLTHMLFFLHFSIPFPFVWYTYNNLCWHVKDRRKCHFKASSVQMKWW
jgi:hypothetical protein